MKPLRQLLMEYVVSVPTTKDILLTMYQNFDESGRGMSFNEEESKLMNELKEKILAKEKENVE